MSFISQFNKDFVWEAVRDALPAKRKHSPTNFLNINCPMCLSRGEARSDSKQRCGVIKNATGFAVSCFNCGFKCRFVFGETLSQPLRAFMRGLGVGDLQIDRLNYIARHLKAIMAPAATAPISQFVPQFSPVALPAGARSLGAWAEDGEKSPDFLATATYIADRGDAIWQASEFFWTPLPGRHSFHRRVIIPFYWDGQIVGWTGRAIDEHIRPRYHSQAPTHFLFNNHFLTAPRRYVLVVEGVLDALALDAVATQGAHLNDQQAEWIASSGKAVIVVPDYDKSGQRLIDAALKHRWAVAFPRQASQLQLWERDVKDTAEAVRRYGRLYVLRSVIETAQTRPNQINVLRRFLTSG